MNNPQKNTRLQYVFFVVAILFGILGTALLYTESYNILGWICILISVSLGSVTYRSVSRI